MASVVKERVSRRGVTYRVDFRDRSGKLYALRGFDYKPAAEAVRMNIRRLEQLRGSPERPDAALAKWLQSVPASWQAKFVQAGLVDGRRMLEARPLWVHLIAFYHALKAKGRTRKHARQVVRRVIAACRGAGLHYFSDVTPGKIEVHLAGLRDNGISAQTYNHHLSNIRQFCRWIVASGRAERNPLQHMKPLEAAKVRAECRRERRAATPDEMQWLLATTQAGPGRYGVDGPGRALAYHFAATTGLRVQEIKSLKVADFDLNGIPPVVTIRAKSAKNSETASLPLSSDLTEAIRPQLATKTPAAPAFDLPHETSFARMLRADIAAAREKWLSGFEDPAERRRQGGLDFLKYTDDAGRTLDFHALRHTRGVWLFQYHGANPREVQELMRVSSVALVDRYARSFRLRDMSLIERGPDLTRPAATAARATGTDGTAREAAQQKAQQKRSSQRHSVTSSGTSAGGQTMVASGAQPPEKQGENAVSRPGTGKATGGTRTHDLRFTKPLLCQLSYGGKISLSYYR